MKKSPKALQQTLPIVMGETWEEVEAAILASPSDADVLATLEHDLVSHGGFVRPVVLDPSDRAVLDGTHRVVAALRTGIAIDVTWGHPAGTSDGEVCEVVFRCEVVDDELARAWSQEDDDSARAFMAVVNALGSIPIADGWLSTPVFSGSRGGECRAAWSAAAGSELPDDESLVEILRARALRAGVRLVVISTDRDPEWLHDE